MTKEKFAVKFRDTELIGDIMPAGEKPKLLVLHGAGGSNKIRYDYLREPLAEKNIPSAAFDFVGHGETGGQLFGSSLEDRTTQAKLVLDRLALSEINILAASMSGYTAIKLTQNFKINSLILFVPCVYSKDAYSLAFGEQFSGDIRKPDSWMNTDAWDILNRFKGNLLIVYGSQDEVVPELLTQKIFENGVSSQKKEMIKLEAPHHIHKYLQTDPQKFTLVINKITEYIS